MVILKLNIPKWYSKFNSTSLVSIIKINRIITYMFYDKKEIIDAKICQKKDQMCRCTLLGRRQDNGMRSVMAPNLDTIQYQFIILISTGTSCLCIF